MSRLAPNCRPSAIVFALLILIVALLSVLAWKVERVPKPSVLAQGAARVAGPAASSARPAADYGKLPISFEANQGQTDKTVQFLARGAGYTVFLTPGEAVLALHAPLANAGKPGDPVAPRTLRPSSRQLPSTTPASIVRLRLIGANTAAEAAGVDPLPGMSNYLIGNDPARWHTDVPTYAKVRYHDVYPGIDLLYYGNHEGRLEHDFVLAPGADPNAIVLRLGGAQRVDLTAAGAIRMHTMAGDASLPLPTSYQMIENQRKQIDTRYQLGSNNEVRLRVGDYDRTRPLIIDPVLQYSTLLGGTDWDAAYGIALDQAGEAYVMGETQSPDFPMKNPIDPLYPQLNPGGSVIFVSKINSTGTGLVFSTYLDGTAGFEEAGGIAVDGAGSAYITGSTDSSDFPVSKGAYQTTHGGEEDVFVTKLSSTGSLVYSTYIGGAYVDRGAAVAIDHAGNAYVTGITEGPYPRTSNSFPDYGGSIFVTEINATGTGLIYSGRLGGASNSSGLAIAVDSGGGAYVTGSTTSIPAVNAMQPTRGGGYDAFVTRISPSGDHLVFSTYLGGAGDDGGHGIALDSSGAAYIGGWVFSSQSVPTPGFPTTWNAIRKSYGGGSTDSFITKLDPNGKLLYSSFFGGNGEDLIYGVAVDQYRTMYVAGTTSSTDFPQLASFRPPDPRSLQGFVATLVPSGTSGKSIHYYSTTLGATLPSEPYGSIVVVQSIAVDPALNAFVAGTTSYPGFPVTAGAFDTTFRAADAFVSKLVIAADMGLALSSTPVTASHGSNLTYYLIAQNNGPDWADYLKLYDLIPPGTAFVSYDAGGGTCTAPAVGDTGYLNCTLPRLGKGASWQVKLVVKVNTPTGGYIVNQGHIRSNMQDLVWQNNYASLTTGVSVFAGSANPVPNISSPLVPDSVAPGGKGLTLQVNGSGFVPESVVKWNGNTRTTQFVSGGRLTASIQATDVAQAGTASVMVVNPAPGGGKSVPVSFSIISPTTSVSLRRTDYDGGQTPTGAVLADLNGDHNLDLVVANSTFGNTVSVFLGSGNGTFKPRVSYQVGDWPNSPSVGDFNGDGIPDLAVANYLNDTISVLLGKGDGTFKGQATYPVGNTPGSFSSLAVGDFNRDGRLDLAVSNCRCFDPGPSTISVLLGNGDGTFQRQIEFAAGSTPAGVVTGDFNRDGKLDLAAINYYDNKLSVLPGNGDGTFQNYVQYPVGSNPYGIEVADLNGDGILDLVTNNYNGNSVSVLLGKGDGTFKPQRQFAIGGNPVSGTVADLNGDGKLDLLISSLSASSVSVLFGRGDGTFLDHVQYAQSSPTGSVAAGDLNGDGRVDMVTTSNQSDEAARVSVFLQTGP